MLPGAGLRDNARFPQALGEQRLAHCVVDLVRASVIEVFALEINLRATEMLRPAPRVIDGARPADVMFELVFELRAKFRIVAVALVRSAQLIERLNQRL